MKIKIEAVQCVVFGAMVYVLVISGSSHASGSPPVFASQHPNVYIFETDENGNRQTLTLPCVIVEPSPTVTYTWFRGDQELPGSMVNGEGSLIVPNITEGEYASREGVEYYCIARDNIGFDVAIRSRTIIVYYAYFDGFQWSDISGESAIPAALNSDVALECDVLDAKPPPQIKWYKNTSEIQESNNACFLDDRRYLVLKNLQPRDFNGQYYCSVTNVNLSQEVPAPTRYVLTDNLMQGELKDYKQIGNLTAFVGNTSFKFAYIGGVFDNTSLNQTINTLFWNETIEVRRTGDIGTIDRDLLSSPGIFPLKAVVRYSGRQKTRRGTLTVNQVPKITNTFQEERDHLVGELNLTYTCEFEGFPLPSVAFYFNGVPVTADSTSNDNIIESDNTLIVLSPQVSHSGIYQCIVSNEFGDDQQAWLLEIRQPIKPQVQPYNFTKLNATDDRDVGALFTREAGSIVSFSVDIVAYPCPSIEWTFNGTLITTSDEMITFNDPCVDETESLQVNWTFTLNVTLTNATSGNYSAELNNTAGTIQLPKSVYITVPEPISVTGLTLNETCLKEGTTVALRCNIHGFPRPEIQFRLNDEIITQEEGDFETFAFEFYDQVVISNVAANTGGRYTCIATNTQGLPQATKQFDYCVEPAITAVTSLTPNPQIGESFSIECTFVGTPTPSVVWSKDGVEFNETDNMLCNREIITTDEVSRLTIAMATKLLNGTYECNISNIAGFASRSFPIEVQVSQNQTLSPGAIVGMVLLIVVAVVLFVTLLIAVVFIRPIIKEIGKKIGLKEGKKKGMEKGLEEGKKKGLEEGKKKGLEEGEKKGLEEWLRGMREVIQDVKEKEVKYVNNRLKFAEFEVKRRREESARHRALMKQMSFTADDIKHKTASDIRANPYT